MTEQSDVNVVIEQPFSSTIVTEPEGGSVSKSLVRHDKLVNILDPLEWVTVKEELDVTGALCQSCYCCDKLQKYVVKDADGKTILKATEDDPWCCDFVCCKSCRRGRKFDMKIVDEDDDEVIFLHMAMPCKCCTCCSCCFYQKFEVQSPPGNLIGSTQESWNWIRPKFKISDNEKTIYNIYGSCCCNSSCCCCKNADFTIYDEESGEEVGVITKKWTGLVKESFTSCDTFKVTFPKESTANQKTLIIAACILIDLLYFEEEDEEQKKMKSDD